MRRNIPDSLCPRNREGSSSFNIAMPMEYSAGSEWQVDSEAAQTSHSAEWPLKVLTRHLDNEEEPLGMKGPKPLFLLMSKL